MKKCSKCKEVKLETEFYKDKSTSAKDKLSRYCKECRLKDSRPYRVKNRVRIVAYLRRYYSLNLAKSREAHLTKCYGMSLEDFSKMVRKQRGRCAICKTHHLECPKAGCRKDTIPLYVDHDHNTGKTRGLLCHRCNARLDRFATPEILRQSARYLQHHNNQ